MNKNCSECEKEFSTYPSRIKKGEGKFCSRKCLGLWNSKNRGGKNHPSWKGGKVKTTCKECKKEFYIFPAKVKYNQGNFCSLKCYGIWQSKNKTGKNHSNWGRIDVICKVCGGKFNIPSGVFKKGYGKFCSSECMGIWRSQYCVKEKNPNWKGGITPELAKRISSPEWNIIRKKIYERDNWTCRICGKHCHKDIQCHHIIPYRITQNNADVNLITLCKSCHPKEERKHYKDLYVKTV